MNIPAKIIEKVNHIPFHLQAEVCYILIEYMRCGSFEHIDVSVDAKLSFTEIQIELDAILAKRRKAREYRLRRKEMLARQKELVEEKTLPETPSCKDAPTDGNSGHKDMTAPTGTTFQGRPLNRRERRALERLQRKRVKNIPLAKLYERNQKLRLSNASMNDPGVML